MLVSSVILAKITKFFCIFATYMEKMVIANDEFFVPVRQMLEEGHSVTIPVKGFSMLPFIRGERDLVCAPTTSSFSISGRKRAAAM